jgi:hypothetical protein
VEAVIASAADLPAGWVDVQDGGTFRLEQTGDGALFAHTVGHDSLKRFLFPPRVPVWHGTREGLLDDAPEPADASSSPTTRRGAQAPSSSPSTAPAPGARASAPRWAPARGSPAGSTSR